MTVCASGSRSAWRVILAAALFLPAGGCGGGNTMPGTAPDDQKIRGLIPSVRESAENAVRFKKVFVDGAAPGEAERPRYHKYAFEIKPPASISGDEATITVAVRKIVATGEGEIVGEAEWTAVRSGEEWKLKTAPLPAAAK
jgi:hypothetical protein